MFSKALFFCRLDRNRYPKVVHFHSIFAKDLVGCHFQMNLFEAGCRLHATKSNVDEVVRFDKFRALFFDHF